MSSPSPAVCTSGALYSSGTPAEAAVYRRGRNAHPHGIPKHATPGEYARATGLEALFGALYLSGQTARIEALFAAMMEEDHAI